MYMKWSTCIRYNNTDYDFTLIEYEMEIFLLDRTTITMISRNENTYYVRNEKTFIRYAKLYNLRVWVLNWCRIGLHSLIWCTMSCEYVRANRNEVGQTSVKNSPSQSTHLISVL